MVAWRVDLMDLTIEKQIIQVAGSINEQVNHGLFITACQLCEDIVVQALMKDHFKCWFIPVCLQISHSLSMVVWFNP